jgi:hypothetical protein
VFNWFKKTKPASTLVEGIDTKVFAGLHLSTEAQEYLVNRWLGETHWFARATRRSRRIFFWLSGTSIVSSSLTALLAGVSINSTSELNRWILAVLGLVSALSTGLLALFQAWSNWKRRSTTLERLKSEGRQFLVRTGAYKSYLSHQDAFDAFVLKVEAIVAEHKTEFFSKEPESASRTASPGKVSSGSDNAA